MPGSYIKSVKSDTYYDEANVQIDEVNYFVQDDLAAAFNRYRAGEYDILTDLPFDQSSSSRTPCRARAISHRSWASTIM